MTGVKRLIRWVSVILIGVNMGCASFGEVVDTHVDTVYLAELDAAPYDVFCIEN